MTTQTLRPLEIIRTMTKAERRLMDLDRLNAWLEAQPLWKIRLIAAFIGIGLNSIQVLVYLYCPDYGTHHVMPPFLEYPKF
jgi:hypothetical protein